MNLILNHINKAEMMSIDMLMRYAFLYAQMDGLKTFNDFSPRVRTSDSARDLKGVFVFKNLFQKVLFSVLFWCFLWCFFLHILVNNSEKLNF
jgi:succinate dehydrogenase/fumarate reductase cytochrome b subunit